jgi:hypothetical protein
MLVRGRGHKVIGILRPLYCSLIPRYSTPQMWRVLGSEAVPYGAITDGEIIIKGYLKEGAQTWGEIFFGAEDGRECSRRLMKHRRSNRSC